MLTSWSWAAWGHALSCLSEAALAGSSKQPGLPFTKQQLSKIVEASCGQHVLAVQVVSSDTQKGESGRAFTAYAIKVTGHDGATWQILRRFR